MKRARLLLRFCTISVTLLSVAFMLLPDTFRGPMLSLGLAGQFLVGTVVLAALGVEVFLFGSSR